MERALRWYDSITLNIYYMGLTTLSQTMTPLVLPLLVQKFVGESQQGAFYGTIRLWSLMVALLVQSLMGMLSDRSTLRFGRRRPFILIGSLANIFFIIGIGFSASLEGMGGYWFLFVMLILLMISSNTAHGAVQGLIPDLVPENQRGRYSGIKAILEVPVPVILVSFTIGPLIANDQMWAAILVATGVMVLSMVITMFAPERPLQAKPAPWDWAPLIQLGIMTAVFTITILGIGQLVNFVGQALVGSPTTILLAGMFITGLAAMVVAVALGVWLSVRIGTGEGYRQNPSFTWWVVNRLAFLVGSTNLASFAVYFLQGRLNLSGGEAAGPASRLIMIVGVFILLLAFPSGLLADRVGRKPLITASGLTATLGTIILLIAPNLTVIYIGAILVGIATGLFYTANWALGTDIVPKKEAGRYLGISNLAGAGAGAIGAYIGGPIADYITKFVPDSPGLGYVLLFAIYGALFIFSVLALTQIKIPKLNIIENVAQ